MRFYRKAWQLKTSTAISSLQSAVEAVIPKGLAGGRKVIAGESFLFPPGNKTFMDEMILKILEELKKHLLIYFNLLLAIIFGFFINEVVGLVLLSLAIGILIGEESKK